MPGARSAAVLSALLCAPLAFAADARATFHGSKDWTDFASAGVVVREQWLTVEGTALTLVHAVRTSPAVPKLEGALFAVETKSGEPWAGTIDTSACPGLETLRALTVLYRQGGMVIVRAGQAERRARPFTDCAELYRTGELAACTLKVPIKAEAVELLSGPDQVSWGPGWISAAMGRVDVPRAPRAGLELTSALRECLGDEAPVLALLEDRLALAGPRNLLRISPELTTQCTPCLEAGPPAPAAVLGPDDVKKWARAAQDAWRAGRRDQALAQWAALYGVYWSGDRAPLPQWVQPFTDFGSALAATKQWDQARQVFEECWSLSKAPSVELLLAMGEVYRELGDADAAKQAWERVLDAAPTKSQREKALAELAKLKR